MNEDETETTQYADEIEQFKEETENEMYSIDINSSKTHVIFGGKDNSAEIYDLLEDKTVTRIEDFTDSVIYTKYISDSRFLIVTADGTVALMEYDKDVCIIDLETDISVAIFNEKLVIGTVDGQVFLYNDELDHINTFGGHSSEIISVDYREGRVLSMCRNFLTAHDEYGRILYTLKSTEANAFRYISSDVICFAREKKIQIFKETKKLFEYAVDDRVETIEMVEKNLVLGGDFDYILLVDTTGHYAIFKLNVNTGVNLIKKMDDYKIVFSTVNDLIGILDIRNISTLKWYEPNVGVIFDFTIGDSKIGVVGEYGFGVVDYNISDF